MKHSFLRFVLLSFPFLLSSCQSIRKDDRITVMIEKGEDYRVFTPAVRIRRGENASFQIGLLNDSQITGISYEDYTLEYSDNVALLTLNHVLYPTLVSVSTTTEFVSVDFSGGKLDGKEEKDYRYPLYREHLRVNLPDLDLVKDGYQLYGYKEEGKEESVPLGSRFDRGCGKLTADFRKEVSASSLNVSPLSEDTCQLVSFVGKEKEIILPSVVDGKRLVSIKEGCFSGIDADIVFVPDSVHRIEEGSFRDCHIDTFSLFDEFYSISDASFVNTSIHRLRINTKKKPCYMDTYFALFSDKCDLLRQYERERKLVLFSGSTTRYGYDSSLFVSSYPQYHPINMGVFAYTNQMPQLEIIEHFLNDGDVLLVSPEFDSNALDLQFFVDRKLDYRFFRMMESDYQLFSYVDLSRYVGVFDAFSAYLEEKREMYIQDYSVSPLYYDDDGNRYNSRIYNEYLDFSLDRIGEVESGRIYQPEIDYTVTRFTDELFDRYNTFYDSYTTKDVQVLYTYAPRNIDSLTKESTLENRKALETLLNQRIHLPIISSMEDSFYPAYDFYKIDDHLTSQGARIRTEKVIQDLKPYLSRE